MRKESGKWFLDIAKKFIVAAVLLTAILSDAKENALVKWYPIRYLEG